jgi:hypothetical protein
LYSKRRTPARLGPEEVTAADPGEATRTRLGGVYQQMRYSLGNVDFSHGIQKLPPLLTVVPLSGRV